MTFIGLPSGGGGVRASINFVCTYQSFCHEIDNAQSIILILLENIKGIFYFEKSKIE